MMIKGALKVAGREDQNSIYFSHQYYLWLNKVVNLSLHLYNFNIFMSCVQVHFMSHVLFYGPCGWVK